MSPNGVASLFSRLTFLWPDARPLEKDQDLFETWLRALRPVEDDEVFEALPLMAQQAPRRPSLAELIQAAKGVRASRPIIALPPYTPQTKRYGEAWYAVGRAVQDHRLPRAEMAALAEQHKLWFANNGADREATAEMLAEVENLAKKTTPILETPGDPKPTFQSRYSDAHKAQYMANVATKAAAEKGENP